MSILLSHPTGNTFSRAAAEALHAHAMLREFHTCIAVGDGSSSPVTSKLFRQRYCPIPNHLIHTHPLRELLRLLTQKRGIFNSLRTHETGALSVDKVYHGLDRKVAKALLKTETPPSAIYAYEDGALRSFFAAKERNITCIYDLPIGYWRAARRIQSEEAELLPEWAATMPVLKDSTPKLERKDDELRLADSIIVASQFTANTLKETPFNLPEPIIIPYGCPRPHATVTPESSSKAPLKVLYVGGLTQRKGIAYLLEAVEQLGSSVELTIIGKRVADCKPLDAALRKYNWIDSLPHSGILDAMRSHDVFVFPSLFEGFGLVLTEALSQGLPIIATDHTCAPDIIEDGKEGFIIPIRNADAIAAALTSLQQDRPRLQAMKTHALKRAGEMGWQIYKDQLVKVVGHIIS